jgi:1,4-dihydroxy-2-naphthoate octaprenyltransferase
MTWRYGFTAFVGLAVIAATLIFGPAGSASMVLFVFLPLVVKLASKRRKPDEREMQLFLMTNNITAALMILTILAVYYGSGIIINGHRLGDQWHLLTIFSFLFWQGVVGLVLSWKKA